jgi:hypothetical protein
VLKGYRVSDWRDVPAIERRLPIRLESLEDPLDRLGRELTEKLARRFPRRTRAQLAASRPGARGRR